jgi:hypothetical protein
MAEEKRRHRRDRVEIIDDTIAKINAEIEKLRKKIVGNEEAKAVLLREKEELLAPKVGIKDITDKIKEQDLPLDEVMKAINRVAKKQQKQASSETQE